MVGTHQLPGAFIKTCTQDNGLLYCFSKWAFNVTTGLWWTALLIGFSFAIFMATYRYGTPRAFGFAGFVGMMGAIFLAVAQLMPWWVASIFILVGALAIGGMIVSKS